MADSRLATEGYADRAAEDAVSTHAAESGLHLPTTGKASGKVLKVGSDGETPEWGTGGGGGEPDEYLKDAEVDGETLTLTKKDGTTVELDVSGKRDKTDNTCHQTASFGSWKVATPPSGYTLDEQPVFDSETSKWKWHLEGESEDLDAESGASTASATSATFTFVDAEEATRTFTATRSSSQVATAGGTFVTDDYVDAQNATKAAQTPTFTEASTLATVNSGEACETMWGKVKKAISSLISHFSDSSAHSSLFDGKAQAKIVGKSSVDIEASESPGVTALRVEVLGTLADPTAMYLYLIKASGSTAKRTLTITKSGTAVTGTDSLGTVVYDTRYTVAQITITASGNEYSATLNQDLYDTTTAADSEKLNGKTETELLAEKQDSLAYSSTKTYAAGEPCIYSNALYTSKLASNTGHRPDLSESYNYWQKVADSLPKSGGSMSGLLFFSPGIGIDFDSVQLYQPTTDPCSLEVFYKYVGLKSKLTPDGTNFATMKKVLPSGAADWDEDTSYTAGQTCWYNSYLWMAKQATTGNTPADGSAYWFKITDPSSLFTSDNTLLVAVCKAYGGTQIKQDSEGNFYYEVEE